MAGELIMQPYTNPQEEANERLPLGWCNQCVGTAKQAQADGAPDIPPINAAVTMVGKVQNFAHPQMGPIPAVVVVPICWDCIIIQPKASGLVHGQPGMPA